jgi:hypothetical protein
MLDSDLAALYDVETKRLKEQVKRNIDRFPPDFMFELTREESFTEHGVVMLSSVINSQLGFIAIRETRLKNESENEIKESEEKVNNKK